MAIISLNYLRDRAYEASAIRDWLLSNLTPNAAKRCLVQIKACCNWAMEEGLIETNPFGFMKIKLPKAAYEARAAGEILLSA